MKAASQATSPSFMRRVEQWLVGWTDALPLRVFEIFFCATYAIWIGRNFIYWREWLTDEGFHFDKETLLQMGFPEPLPLPPAWCVPLLALITLVGVWLVIISCKRRLGLLLCLATAFYFQGVDIPAAYTLNKLYVVVFGLLFLMPGYTTDSRTGIRYVSNCNVRVIQATLLLMYLASGLAKAFWGDWLKYGDVLHTQVMGVYRTELAAHSLNILPRWTWTVMQSLALLFEIGACVWLALPWSRKVAIWFGVLFHLTIALLMKDLIFFSIQIWSFYVLFLNPEELRVIARRAVGCQRVLSACLFPKRL